MQRSKFSFNVCVVDVTFVFFKKNLESDKEKKQVFNCVSIYAMLQSRRRALKIVLSNIFRCRLAACVSCAGPGLLLFIYLFFFFFALLVCSGFFHRVRARKHAQKQHTREANYESLWNFPLYVCGIIISPFALLTYPRTERFCEITIH